MDVDDMEMGVMKTDGEEEDGIGWSVCGKPSWRQAT